MSLESQSKRADDSRFLAQVRAAILNEARLMLRKSGPWSASEADAKAGVVSSQQSVAMRAIDDPYTIGARVARLVVSDSGVEEVAPKTADGVTDYTVDDAVVTRSVRAALRALAGRE